MLGREMVPGTGDRKIDKLPMGDGVSLANRSAMWYNTKYMYLGTSGSIVFCFAADLLETARYDGFEASIENRGYDIETRME